jgi:AcrR family transcriptional regulator
LTRTASPLLDPRKTPVQARSAVTVDAILSATIQVLLAEGQERLTTTRVAYRAGVSVGTLYQYFPNKKALLRAVLERHLDEVVSSIERACREYRSCSLDEMASGVITAFLEAKMKSVRTSAALYAVAADVDGNRIAREAGRRTCDALASMLASGTAELATEPMRLAELLHGAMTGIARRLIESPTPHKLHESYRAELIRLVSAYLNASTRPAL